MKLLASILLTLVLAASVVAQQAYTFTAYSVTDIASSAANTFTATVSVSSNKTSKAPIYTNGTSVRIVTSGCSHVPAKGETGIVSNGPLGLSLIFAGGTTTCKVTSVTAAGK